MSPDNLFFIKYFCNHPFSAIRIILLFFLFLCVVGVSERKSLFTLPEVLLKSMEQQYGELSKHRFVAWQSLICDDSNSTDLEKLEKVNRFSSCVRNSTGNKKKRFVACFQF